MGRSHPINNGVWRSHLVPPAPKTSVFMGWDGPTSSHLLPNPQFSWCRTVPPRPTCSQSLSFYGVKWSHLVPLVPKPSVFTGWDGPTLSQLLRNPQCYRVERSSHLLPNPQCLRGGTVPPRPTQLQSVDNWTVKLVHHPVSQSLLFTIQPIKFVPDNP